MNQSNPSGGSVLTLGLIGVAGYFLYTQFFRGGGPDTAPVDPGLPEVEPVIAPTAPAGGWSDGEKTALIRKAAAGDLTAAAQVDALGWKLSADDWNYRRAEGGGGDTTTDLFPEGNRGYPLTAADYLARRRAAGLSGTGLLGIPVVSRRRG